MIDAVFLLRSKTRAGVVTWPYVTRVLFYFSASVVPCKAFASFPSSYVQWLSRGFIRLSMILWSADAISVALTSTPLTPDVYKIIKCIVRHTMPLCGGVAGFTVHEGSLIASCLHFYDAAKPQIIAFISMLWLFSLLKHAQQIKCIGFLSTLGTTILHLFTRYSAIFIAVFLQCTSHGSHNASWWKTSWYDVIWRLCFTCVYRNEAVRESFAWPQ